MHMSGYIKGLNGEFNEFPARLDLHNLTVVIDRPGRPVYMNKSGGGASHLAYQLAALHSLHRFAANYKQPIPRFMVIDQPTQVYFPSESAYRAAGGSIEQTEEQQDANLDAVRRLFEILARFTTKDVPGFQLIVTEHANLRDKWFQDALVEDPWTKPPAERQPETCGISIAYDHEMGARRRKLNAQKPAIGGLFVNSSEIPENIRLHGWGGRDRTSEWGNQNPLPYRLATPQRPENARNIVSQTFSSPVGLQTVPCLFNRPATPEKVGPISNPFPSGGTASRLPGKVESRAFWWKDCSRLII